MTSNLVLGLSFGIIFICIGVFLGGVSLLLLRSKGHIRYYDAQLWQPKFIKTMPDEERDKIGRHNAKLTIRLSLFIIAIGLGTILNGALSIIDTMIIVNIMIVLFLLFIPAGYVFMYLQWRKMHSADKNK